MSKENKTKKIFRVEKDKNYSVIHNPIFLDKRISWGAKGVLGYALTKPDDWDLYISEVTKNGSDKIDKVTKYFKELRLAGYLDYVITREKGKITKTEYLLYEKPLHMNPINMITRHQVRKEKERLKKLLEIEKPNLESPRQEKPQMDSPSVENTPLINTDSLPNTDINKILREEREPEKQSTPIKEEKDSLSFMNLKQRFVEKLTSLGIEYITTIKDQRNAIPTMQELKISPQEIIDLVDKLNTVKKNNPNDKFFKGICFTLSDLISYRSKIINEHQTGTNNSNVVIFPSYNIEELNKEGWR